MNMMTSTTTTRPSIRTSDPEYVLGTGMDEASRLGLQHRLWSSAAHLLWERAGVQPGMTVIDLGCGPGHAAVDLAQIVGPTGRVIAVDESAPFLKQLSDEAHARKLHNVERVLGDIQTLEAILPRSAHMIDAAYARWVFCFLSKPEDAIAGLARELRSGGKLIVQDYFNYEAGMTLAPRNEAFRKVVHAVAASWRARGGDPDVMGRLPKLLREHGFRVEHMDVHQRMARPGTTLWHWPDSFFRNFVPKLTEQGFISAAEQAAFEQAWAAASNDPDCFVMTPPVFDLIAVRE
jgi:ubiquinone/menaquinone biosynthesis C-methylase UbiE